MALARSSPCSRSSPATAAPLELQRNRRARHRSRLRSGEDRHQQRCLASDVSRAFSDTLRFSSARGFSCRFLACEPTLSLRRQETGPRLYRGVSRCGARTFCRVPKGALRNGSLRTFPRPFGNAIWPVREPQSFRWFHRSLRTLDPRRRVKNLAPQRVVGGSSRRNLGSHGDLTLSVPFPGRAHRGRRGPRRARLAHETTCTHPRRGHCGCALSRSLRAVESYRSVLDAQKSGHRRLGAVPFGPLVRLLWHRFRRAGFGNRPRDLCRSDSGLSQRACGDTGRICGERLGSALVRDRLSRHPRSTGVLWRDRARGLQDDRRGKVTTSPGAALGAHRGSGCAPGSRSLRFQPTHPLKRPAICDHGRPHRRPRGRATSPMEASPSSRSRRGTPRRHVSRGPRRGCGPEPAADATD